MRLLSETYAFRRTDQYFGGHRYPPTTEMFFSTRFSLPSSCILRSHSFICTNVSIYQPCHQAASLLPEHLPVSADRSSATSNLSSAARPTTVPNTKYDVPWCRLSELQGHMRRITGIRIQPRHAHGHECIHFWMNRWERGPYFFHSIIEWESKGIITRAIRSRALGFLRKCIVMLRRDRVVRAGRCLTMALGILFRSGAAVVPQNVDPQIPHFPRTHIRPLR